MNEPQAPGRSLVVLSFLCQKKRLTDVYKMLVSAQQRQAQGKNLDSLKRETWATLFPCLSPIEGLITCKKTPATL